MTIEQKQLLVNLENYDCWSYKHYPLTKEEAAICIEILKEKEGVSTEDESNSEVPRK